MTQPFYKRTLLVTGLDKEATQSDLVDAFSSVGPDEALVFSDPGFAGVQKSAYVIFSDGTGVSQALEVDVTHRLGEVSLSQADASHEEALYKSLIRQDKASLSELEQQLGQLEASDLSALLSKFSHRADRRSDPKGVSAQPSVSVGNPPASYAFPPTQQHIAMGSIPKLALFSGDLSKGEPIKGELTYNQWRYEVRCLQKEGHSPAEIVKAIRRSARGTAAEILRCLRDGAPLLKVLRKFEDCFKSYLSKDQLFPRFYAAQQGANERVAAWGCRLEDLLSDILEQGGISENASEDMLRTKFWHGLRDPRIREATRHHIDGGMSYEDLFREVRKVEQEFMSRGKDEPISKQQSVTSDPVLKMVTEIASNVALLRDDVASLKKRVEHVESHPPGNSVPPSIETPQGKSPNPTRIRKKKSVVCSRCGRVGHAKQKCVARFHVKGYPLNEKTPSLVGKNEGETHQ